ncbi:glycosyltransferase [Prosthecobacter sp.]|uniref:glycosyltransferase n=1 Tax=Prosthecobacter sp. TaxID=1965333 RepID=UPI003783AEFB
MEFFNEIAAGGEVQLRVIYLRRQHSLHPWGRVELRHEHVVLEGHSEMIGQAFRWVLGADLTVCNYYTHWFALAALHLRHLSSRPWVFWGERPGFLRLGWLGRLSRRLLLYPIARSVAPIWAIGRAGVVGYMNDWGVDKDYVNLPYFSDLSRFRNQPRAARAEERVVLYSGQLNSRKGVLGLAEGFLVAALVHSNLRLMILGSGPLEQQMREILKPVADRVFWEGFREWPELPAYYARAHALCLPTRHDGWAMVVPEALAAGLPVITTMDAGAALELVTHDVNGWVLPNSSPQAIEQAITRLAELPAEGLARFSAAARESVEGHTLDEGSSRFVTAAREAVAAYSVSLVSQAPANAAKTLIVFRVNQLGDNVVYLPIVQSLVAAYPGWRIVVLTSTTAARLYQVCCPQVELRVYEGPKFTGAWRKPWVLAKMAADLRALRPDVCLLGDDQGTVSHMLALMSGAKLCVGADSPHVRLNYQLHHREARKGNESVAAHNWRIARSQFALPEKKPAPDLRAFGCDASGAIVIHAGASREYQRWPPHQYIELANRLAETHPVRWISQGEDSGLSDAVTRVKTTSLDDLVRVIAGAKLFVGNNSGPMHIASALGTPGVILIGPSSPRWDPSWHRERFTLLREPLLTCQPCDSPIAPVNRCLNTLAPMACLNRWSVDRVLMEVLRRCENS